MERSWGVVVNEQDCDIWESEFEFQSRYYDHFWTNTPGIGMNHVIPSTIDKIVSLMFFSKNGSGIK